jgi:hypothetical protein
MYLASTRFNNDTWEENNSYRIRKNIDCIYGIRQKIKESVPLNSYLFVLEMNNSKNRIEGIGLIKNMILFDKHYHIYENGDFNRYIYKGDYWIDQLEISEELLNVFHTILFKGYTHLKRLPGITIVPEKLLKHEICIHIDILYEIKKYFICKYPDLEKKFISIL